jgi:hypothetical protein
MEFYTGAFYEYLLHVSSFHVAMTYVMTILLARFCANLERHSLNTYHIKIYQIKAFKNNGTHYMSDTEFPKASAFYI